MPPDETTAPPANTPDTSPGEEVVEPENSTVDDWFGQNVARDQDVADAAMDEADGDADKAQEIFDEQAEGQAKYDEGHPRP